MGVLYWKRHRRGRSFGPRRRGGLPVDTPQLDGATPLCVAAPRKNETRSPGDIAAKSRSSQDVEVPPSKCAIPCGGCCGSPLGRGGPGGPSPSPPRRGRAMGHTMFSAHELFSERRKDFSELPKVFSGQRAGCCCCGGEASWESNVGGSRGAGRWAGAQGGGVLDDQSG